MDESLTTTVTASIEIPLGPEEAFDLLIQELATSLKQAGMEFEPGENGRLTQAAFEVGRVVTWKPGNLARLEWRPASWKPDEITEVELRLEPINGGTRATLEQRGWGRLIDGPFELAGWFAGQVATPLLYAVTPLGFGSWITDRIARRPSGAGARSIYRNPIYHYPNFYVILDELKLAADDFLVEVGCGGGAFLHMALECGCRAAAVDHSVEMVHLAREVNQEAIDEGRLDIQLASADLLPFPDSTFSAAVMTGVFGFLPDPVAALQEIRRVLAPGGRIVVMGSDPELRGTPAAPEPISGLLRFYQDDEFRQLALDAGFDGALVVRLDLEPYARKAGVPDEALPLFSGAGTPFLLARKA